MSDLAEKRLKKELAMLFAIVAALAALSIRPFGFRHFLHGLENNDIFSILILMGIVGAFLVILQRLGIIFPEATAQEIR